MLEFVANSDPVRNDILRKLDLLNKATAAGESPDLARAFRQLELENAERDLFQLEKEARLRSGARGYDVRAELRKQEAKVVALRQQLEATGSESDAPESVEEHAQEGAQLQSELQSQLETMALRDLEERATRILLGLGFSNERITQKVSKLSGGWQMRCFLAAALTQPADLLVLDEPTNHLDMLGIIWLQRHLMEVKEDAPDRSVLLISHDRDFVNSICEELILIKNKQLVYFPGNLDSYDKSMYRQRLRLTRMKEAQDRQIAHIKSSIADNMRQGKKTGDDGKLKQAKSRQKKLDDRMGVEISAKGTKFKLNRDLGGYHLKSRAEIEVPHEEAGVNMTFPPPADLRFPGSLVSLENVSLKYKATPRPVLSEVNLIVHPGDRIGILGLNGAGKTTLIRLLTGSLRVSSGSVQKHPRLKVGYYSQLEVDVLGKHGKQDLGVTALSLVRGGASEAGIDLQEQAARALLGGMGLQGRVASETPIAQLSGGQLVRLALSLLLIDPPQLFILDEPTTHLDVYTVTALAKALQGFEGAVVLVTHDRFFMRTVVEGHSAERYYSDDEDEGPCQEDEQADGRRRVIYEVKAGKLTACEGGVDSWETSLEKKLSKLDIG